MLGTVLSALLKLTPLILVTTHKIGTIIHKIGTDITIQQMRS